MRNLRLAKTYFTVLAAALFAFEFSGFSQGLLTPPGVPAATMKTLAQIEPRTPISSLPFTISSRGSYYLTTNLTTGASNAIVITVSGVTLDLGGFTISSSVANAANGGTAILIAAPASTVLNDITICNGHIRGGVTNNGSGFYTGSGFNGGIYFTGDPPLNVLVSRVSVSGCLTYGIELDSNGSSSVEFCGVRTIGSFGILAATVENSTASDCSNFGIGAGHASNCEGESTASGGAGIEVTTAINCIGRNEADGTGLYAAVANNCYGASSAGPGILASTATGCYGASSSGTGISAVTAMNCYGLTGGGSGAGIDVQTANNCVGSAGGSGFGVRASAVAVGCNGYSGTGTGLSAFIANVCHGTTSSGTALSTSHNVSSF